MDGDLPANNDWDPFGRPLFDDVSTRALHRVGVIDVGSNSVRFVIFDGAARSPAYFFNEKVMCGLGTGLGETGHLHPEGRVRAVAALARFAAIAKTAKIQDLSIVATAAVRDASDGAAFRDEIKEVTGLDIWVIDGREEARLSAQGVLLGWPGAYGLVCDIGGSSLELAEINGGRVGKRSTSPLGPLKLASFESREDRKDEIDLHLARMMEELGPQKDRLFLVGGSWRAIARIDMERRGYPLHVLHEYRMTDDDVQAVAEYIANADIEALRQTCGISSARMSLVPLASEVLARLMKHIKPYDIAVSAYGIREGLLYEQMPQRLRDRDPLVEACRFAEKKDARLPGFGKRLYEFVMPLFPHADADRRRIIKAACLLHDVTWRAHPDYRAEVCFDNATRANLGGLGHADRVFLALALMHRYRNKREGSRIEPMLSLLSDDDLHAAEVLGKAMRFGAMLWNDGETEAATLSWDAATTTLGLTLTKQSQPLYGEVAQARFASLAGALNAETDITVA
ncbi:Ppx/GppA family phosphatase [Shimia ponticola]|uniref:Ppx/GppA family phosphatase n=1 Tax=Shimia ponticola TaxID=2582893 RepID=UPI0011BF2E1D|nr:Ppx/GppA family phosphatase [Shimia ponticola]